MVSNNTKVTYQPGAPLQTVRGYMSVVLRFENGKFKYSDRLELHKSMSDAIEYANKYCTQRNK